jgi:hypothetical protein
MAEEKGALQSAREWIVDHKLRAVGTSPNYFCSAAEAPPLC